MTKTQKIKRTIAGTIVGLLMLCGVSVLGAPAASAATVTSCYSQWVGGSKASFWITWRYIDYNWWEEHVLLKKDGWYSSYDQNCW